MTATRVSTTANTFVHLYLCKNKPTNPNIAHPKPKDLAQVPKVTATSVTERIGAIPTTFSENPSVLKELPNKLMSSARHVPLILFNDVNHVA